MIASYVLSFLFYLRGKKEKKEMYKQIEDKEFNKIYYFIEMFVKPMIKFFYEKDCSY